MRLTINTTDISFVDALVLLEKAYNVAPARDTQPPYYGKRAIEPGPWIPQRLRRSAQADDKGDSS